MASKAFNAYKEIADKVRKETPHTAKGEAVITVSSLKPAKAKENHGEQVFYLNSKSNEALQFTITANGNLKSAKYIDKAAEEGSKATFLAKDIDKMHEIVKDPALKKFAEEMNWEKVAPKEAEAPEAEAEAEAEKE